MPRCATVVSSDDNIVESIVVHEHSLCKKLIARRVKPTPWTMVRLLNTDSDCCEDLTEAFVAGIIITPIRW